MATPKPSSLTNQFKANQLFSKGIHLSWITYTCLFIIAVGPSRTEAFAESKLGKKLQDTFTAKDIAKAEFVDQNDIKQKCSNCRLTSTSIEEILRKPRQMNSYGQIDDRIDLEKIKKAVCRDLINDQERERCRSFYFNHISTIQKWKQIYARMSFMDFVCIKELKYCCPRNSFGPTCTKCQECGPNQHCHGDGTRSGNGTCVCKEGHTGPGCASCVPGYYLDKKNINGLNEISSMALCRQCHRSCLYCRQEGPLGCEVCQSGFNWVPTYGCSDIDECIQSNKKICGDNTFCVNTEGSYFCYECDRACDGCHGDGPDMCIKCGKGYKMENENCVALKKSILAPEANYYRYAIYLGLGLSTCIILSHNIFMASMIGLGVAIYIGCSEYIMLNHVLDKEGKTHLPMIT